MVAMEDVLKLGIVDNDELTIGALTAYLRRHEPVIRIAWTVTAGRKAIELCLNEKKRPDGFLLTCLCLIWKVLKLCAGFACERH